MNSLYMGEKTGQVDCEDMLERQGVITGIRWGKEETTVCQNELMRCCQNAYEQGRLTQEKAE